MLWLALHFPRLAVEVFAADPPAAVVVQQRVVAADAQAEAAGLRPGMRLSSALGLVPGLAVRTLDPPRQANALAALACWAGQFSPQLSVASDTELVLEIQGSLRLFGGLPSLLARVRSEGAAQGFTLRLGLAPTPLAAQWYARAGVAPEASVSVATPPVTATPDTLTELPVAVLDLPAADHRRLATLGLQRLGQLLALPAAALTRRFGPALTQQLAHATGALPDLRPPFAFPEQFAQRLELPARVDHAAMLLFAARRLVMALAGWLQARAAGLRECLLELVHEDIAPSPLTLGFATATRDPERLLRVLRERLDRLQLAAPVVELRLSATAVEALPGHSAGLFGERGGDGIAPVVERLRARLGRAAVHGLAVVPEHRPECASRATDWPQPGDSPAGLADGARPLWLLPAPQPLAERRGRPQHDGPLRLLTRGERIESGWWDGGEGHGDQRRDYFVALSSRGAWLWVFRDDRGWWLHGHFA